MNLGRVWLRRAGIKTGWVSGRASPVTKLRADELKIDFLVPQEAGKVAAVESILTRAGFRGRKFVTWATTSWTWEY